VSLANEGPHVSSRSYPALIALCSAGILVAAGFFALGVWQLERRVWKLDLISRIEHRVNAAPVDAPGPDAWPSVTASHDAYRHVHAKGVWIEGHDTLVQAVTDLGAGYWVMTPLKTAAGFIVLVNRGFAPADNAHDPSLQPRSNQADVTGLLRVTEPKGGFLRSNDAANDRWYSRDVSAIAQARGLNDVAPYFIDEAATPGDAFPVGGLTVLTQPNNHLVYAFTWFTLAAMTLGATAYLVRMERR
jgi:surfeit locus 1 family protein